MQTTKVDAEYPDNKLTGAVFEVYVDADGNQEFDPDIDRMVGEMNEIEDGVYQMDGLRYNGISCMKNRVPKDSSRMKIITILRSGMTAKL